MSRKPHIPSSSTTTHGSQNYHATSDILDRLKIWSRDQGYKSISEIARRYSGSLWRPYQYPFLAANSLRCAAANFLLGAGIEFRSRNPVRSICLTDFPAVQADAQLIFAPTNLLEVARIGRHMNEGGYESSVGRLDLAMDATAGYCLLNGSTRPTMYAMRVEPRNDRLCFGHSISPVFPNCAPPSRAERLLVVRQGFEAARNDLCPRFRCHPMQIQLARKAQYVLVEQFRLEASNSDLHPIDRALRVWLLRWLWPSYDEEIGFGADEYGEKLLDYHNDAAACDDGSEAYRIFVEELPEDNDEDENEDEDEDEDEHAPSDETPVGIDGSTRQRHSVAHQRAALDAATTMVADQRKCAEENDQTLQDELRIAKETNLDFANRAGNSATDLAELAADEMTAGSIPRNESVEPDPRSCAEIASDYTALPITIK